jgi:hypothetical protein
MKTAGNQVSKDSAAAVTRSKRTLLPYKLRNRGWGLDLNLQHTDALELRGVLPESSSNGKVLLIRKSRHRKTKLARAEFNSTNHIPQRLGANFGDKVRVPGENRL